MMAGGEDEGQEKDGSGLNSCGIDVLKVGMEILRAKRFFLSHKVTCCNGRSPAPPPPLKKKKPMEIQQNEDPILQVLCEFLFATSQGG